MQAIALPSPVINGFQTGENTYHRYAVLDIENQVHYPADVPTGPKNRKHHVRHDSFHPDVNGASIVHESTVVPVSPSVSKFAANISAPRTQRVTSFSCDDGYTKLSHAYMVNKQNSLNLKKENCGPQQLPAPLFIGKAYRAVIQAQEAKVATKGPKKFVSKIHAINERIRVLEGKSHSATYPALTASANIIGGTAAGNVTKQDDSPAKSVYTVGTSSTTVKGHSSVHGSPKKPRNVLSPPTVKVTPMTPEAKTTAIKSPASKINLTVPKTNISGTPRRLGRAARVGEATPSRTLATSIVSAPPTTPLYKSCVNNGTPMHHPRPTKVISAADVEQGVKVPEPASYVPRSISPAWSDDSIFLINATSDEPHEAGNRASQNTFGTATNNVAKNSAAPVKARDPITATPKKFVPARRPAPAPIAIPAIEKFAIAARSCNQNLVDENNNKVTITNYYDQVAESYYTPSPKEQMSRVQLWLNGLSIGAAPPKKTPSEPSVQYSPEPHKRELACHNPIDTYNGGLTVHDYVYCPMARHLAMRPAAHAVGTAFGRPNATWEELQVSQYFPLRYDSLYVQNEQMGLVPLSSQVQIQRGNRRQQRSRFF